MTVESNAAENADPIGRELMRQAQLIGQLRRDLDELAHATTDIAADFLARLEEFGDAGASSAARRSWCWRTVGPAAEEALWSELKEWVGWLRSRYPLAKKIPPCWPRHPEIVEELTALWLAWEHAYTDATAPLTAPAEWHDHWLPGFLHRLEHGPHAVNCAVEHASRPSSAYA